MAGELRCQEGPRLSPVCGGAADGPHISPPCTPCFNHTSILPPVSAKTFRTTAGEFSLGVAGFLDFSTAPGTGVVK